MWFQKHATCTTQTMLHKKVKKACHYIDGLVLKTAVSPLLMHGRYCSVRLSYEYISPQHLGLPSKHLYFLRNVKGLQSTFNWIVQSYIHTFTAAPSWVIIEPWARWEAITESLVAIGPVVLPGRVTLETYKHMPPMSHPCWGSLRTQHTTCMETGLFRKN